MLQSVQHEKQQKNMTKKFLFKKTSLYFKLPMQAAIIIIIVTVKQSGTVKKIQLYMYIEKGWLSL